MSDQSEEDDWRLVKPEDVEDWQAIAEIHGVPIVLVPRGEKRRRHVTGVLLLECLRCGGDYYLSPEDDLCGPCRYGAAWDADLAKAYGGRLGGRPRLETDDPKLARKRELARERQRRRRERLRRGG